MHVFTAYFCVRLIFDRFMVLTSIFYPLYCDHLNSLTSQYEKVCMHVTFATLNQLVTDVVNMLECHFGRSRYKEVRVYANPLYSSHTKLLKTILMKILET